MQNLTKFKTLILFSLIVFIFSFFWLGTQLGTSNKSSTQLIAFNLTAPTSSLEDFARYTDIQTKKAKFFQSLAPLVMYENERITWRKNQLLAAQQLVNTHQQDQLTEQDIQTLENIAQAYSASWPLSDAELEQLLVKIQPLPVDLVLIQAANESAWGTSRFAKQANNLFGQWCFTQGCGLVPSQRSAGLNHEVRKFATPLASVQSYMHNLNTHQAYKQLREVRHQQVLAGKNITGASLAPGLLSYSERGQAYVNELLAMLKQNKTLIDEAINLASSD